mgnify:CR=1 FL=1
MEQYTAIDLYLDAWIISILLFVYYRKNMHITANPNARTADWCKVMGACLISIGTGVIATVIGATWVYNHIQY